MPIDDGARVLGTRRIPARWSRAVHRPSTAALIGCHATWGPGADGTARRVGHPRVEACREQVGGHRRCTAAGAPAQAGGRANGGRSMPDPRRGRTARAAGCRVEDEEGGVPVGGSGAAPSAHQARYPAEQRQGRALHSDRLAAMGRCTGGRIIRPARSTSTPAGCTHTAGTDHMPAFTISRRSPESLLRTAWWVDSIRPARRGP